MKRQSRLFRRQNKAGYLFVIPWVIGFCLFFVYPLFYSLVLSFSSIQDAATFKLKFVFLDNFRQALTTDVDFLPDLYNSMISTVTTIPVLIVFSLFVAVLLNKHLKGRGFFRVAFLLPVLLGTGAVMKALQGNNSYVGVAMGSVSNAAATASFQDIELSRQLIALLGTQLSGSIGPVINKISSVMWMSGIQIIIFLGTLQTIPPQLYEASVVDGASEFDKLWKITLPLMMPTIELNTIYTLIDSFTSSGNKVMSYISTVSFTNFMLSYGSALSWLYFIFISILLVIIFAIMRRYMFYMG